MNTEIFENFFKTTIFKTKPNRLILSAVDYAAAENEMEKDEAKLTSSVKWRDPASVNFARANAGKILNNLLPAKVSKRKRTLEECAWDFVSKDKSKKRVTGILHDVKAKKSLPQIARSCIFATCKRMMGRISLLLNFRTSKKHLAWIFRTGNTLCRVLKS